MELIEQSTESKTKKFQIGTEEDILKRYVTTSPTIVLFKFNETYSKWFYMPGEEDTSARLDEEELILIASKLFELNSSKS